MNFKIEEPKGTEIQKLVNKGYEISLNKKPFFSLVKYVSDSVIVDINIWPEVNISYLMLRLINNKLGYMNPKEMEDDVNTFRDSIYDIFSVFNVIERLD